MEGILIIEERMGSTSQLYSLSWGEFSTSLTSAVQLLRGHGELVDVTLAAGGRSFPAHKIVLSAASPFLLDLLKSTPCQHPVVMLAGIGADDLESLLEFVYRGEVSVEPAQLPSLLQAAHCLSIHGLTPPTILTENGEEIPISAIPSANEALTRDVLNSYLPVRRRKKRRKSSSSSGKWPKTNDHTNTENRPLDSQSQENRTADYDHKDSETTSQTEDMASERLECANHWSANSPNPQQPLAVDAENTQQSEHQEQMMDTESNYPTLMPMQPYSPLQIPSFNLSPAVPIPEPGHCSSSSYAATSLANIMGAGKIRGASDCPGVCPLCGARLRQARNLRRHLLSSCKYRFNSGATQQSISDSMMIEIKPEVEIPGYTGQNSGDGTDSGTNNSCEQIECKPSPLHSPSSHGSNVVSPLPSNIPSPTIAR
ncbi:transcription factor GAGA isoform X3 [Cephus cinctus]|uniref:Transcription factor GAGA isoform X3 n=1 Tax=Cephus cinctus TaxID=211228 RepID=A0AAJ7BXF3_CEPCN|nr:transcription factor GAGA isoform X3 [Cephus cinctus]